MKKLYVLFLFCGALAYAQPQLLNPQPLSQCDIDGDGLGTFNLMPVIAEILGPLDPVQHTATFHVSNENAQQDSYEITDIANFMTTVPHAQTLFVRVEENQNPEAYSVVSLQLIVNLMPSATVSAAQNAFCVGEAVSVTFEASGAIPPYTFSYKINNGPVQTLESPTSTATLSLPSDQPAALSLTLINVATVYSCVTQVNSQITLNILEPAFAFPVSPIVVEEDPNDGVALFDLTSKEAALVNGQTNVTVSYYLNAEDATNGSNPIADPTAFVNSTNPQPIWARVESTASTCFGVTDFDLVVADAGVVYIPDANFKNGLIGLGFDTNFDGKIQLTEAAQVTTMTVDNLDISDLTGIKSFVNLLNLYAMNNLLTTVDISGMDNLRLAYLGDNDINAINLEGASDLRDLVLDQNQLEILVIKDKPNLDRFSAVFNTISGLFLENLPALREVKVIGNELALLDMTAFPMLQILECSVNQLSNLNVTGLSALKTLDCSGNLISDINVEGLAELENLNFNDNPVETHAWNGLSSLKNLQFRNTGISVMDLPASETLQVLNCQGNGMTALNVAIYPALTSLNCRQNQLNTLDVNVNFNLQLLALSDNGMQTLFAKNGVNEPLQISDFTSNNFSYICADESQVAAIQALAGNGVEVNSLCTVVPGGIYNTIQGVVTFDAEGDGCDVSDEARAFLKMRMVSDLEEVDVFTNDAAFYDFYVSQGEYNLYPVLENNYFTIVPSSAMVNFGAVDGSVSTHDFCLAASTPSADAEIAIIPVTPARPGQQAEYTIVIRNKGNQALSQNSGIQFQYDESLMDFVSSSSTPSYTAAGILVWDYSNLRPFESRSISVTLQVNSGSDNPPVQVDDQMTFTAQLAALNDVLPADNVFTFGQRVLSAFDPNYKTCLQGDVVPVTTIGDYLYYAINFENTGTEQAQDIIIQDVLDPLMFDRSSLQILSSTHPVTARSSSQGITLVFQTINMDSGGHGNILLKVRSRGNLVEGSTVSNMADIYLNYRTSIPTETAHTTFEALSVGEPSEGVSVNLYPNPVEHSFTVKSDNEIKSLQLLDIQGRLLQVKMVGAKDAVLDISNRETGVYFVKVTTEKGVKTEKIIKK